MKKYLNFILERIYISNEDIKLFEESTYINNIEILFNFKSIKHRNDNSYNLWYINKFGHVFQQRKNEKILNITCRVMENTINKIHYNNYSKGRNYAINIFYTLLQKYFNITDYRFGNINLDN